MRSSGNDALVDELEAELRLAAIDLTGPRPRECLLCYVDRMLADFGCRGLVWATRFRDERATRATGLEEQLRRLGAGCDCEIFHVGYALAPRYRQLDDAGTVVPVSPAPGCLGVPRRSAAPCGLWVRRYR